MFKEIFSVLQGAVTWQVLRMRLRIDKKKVILVLTGENQTLDNYALLHLKDFADRKYADGVIVLSADKVAQKKIRVIRALGLDVPVRWCRWSKQKIRYLYRYYSFYLFSDKIVFTYTSQPKDNQLGKLLSETEVNEEEVVCLGLYRLRAVPHIKKGCTRGFHHV